MATKKRWQDLDSNTRKLIKIAAVAEGLVKLVALNDLRRRPAELVRGPKLGWATAITLVNSVGMVPLAYFKWGRLPAPSAD